MTFKIGAEPDFQPLFNDVFESENDYFSCADVAKQLNLSPKIISIITGSLIVTENPLSFSVEKPHDIGLRLKHNKLNKEVIIFLCLAFRNISLDKFLAHKI